MTYHRIVTALDTSSLQSIVFEQALDIAKLHQAELKLLHCVETDVNHLETSSLSPVGTPLDAYYLSPSSVEIEMAQQAWEAQIVESKQWLQELCQTAEQQGVKASIEAELGNPGPQIGILAQDWQADLIIVGRHGRTGLTELLLGSVSNHIVHHAPCSVLVIQGVAIASTISSAEVSS